MTILVTGGAGFVGSHLVDALVKDGHRLIVVDHHERTRLRFPNSEAMTFRLRFSDPQVRDIMLAEKPEVIVHLAAQISVTKSIENPIFDAERNLIESLDLITRAREAGVKKIVFASSGGAIYGNHPWRPTPELWDTTPLSPYGITKQVFEWYLEQAAKNFGFSFAALRFSNLYGPRQQVTKPAGEGSVIAQFLDRLLVTGEPFTIFGDGTATRDFLYIADAVDALKQTITTGAEGIVNVASGQATSVNELIQLLFKLHGHEHPLRYEPYREGEVLHSVLDPSAAKLLLAWQPHTSFEAGLKTTYAWYKETFGRSSYASFKP